MVTTGTFTMGTLANQNIEKPFLMESGENVIMNIYLTYFAYSVASTVEYIYVFYENVVFPWTLAKVHIHLLSTGQNIYDM